MLVIDCKPIGSHSSLAATGCLNEAHNADKGGLVTLLREGVEDPQIECNIAQTLN